MTKNEVLKLALEALEYIDLCDNDRDFLHPHECFQLDEAIAAVKQARSAPVQEPVAHINQNGVIHEAGYEWGPTNTLTPLYTLPPAQPALVQEPVTMEGGKRLIVVDQSFDDLMYWLDRCEDKGHLENCPDLVEPWSAFQYENYTTPPAAQPAVQEPTCKQSLQVWVISNGKGAGQFSWDPQDERFWTRMEPVTPTAS
jgi:hypothetical protein